MPHTPQENTCVSMKETDGLTISTQIVAMIRGGLHVAHILNLTRDVSMYKMSLKVILSQSLTHTEAVLKRNLASMQKGNDRIISLSYPGVTALGGNPDADALSTFTLAIGAYCRQDDIEEVELYLNRQIRLMCERENIRIA